MVWRPRVRSRIASSRHTGSVLQWKTTHGWITPDVTIDHPEAAKHGRRVYVNVKDIDASTELYGGARISFFAYSDGDGIGAEEVRLEDCEDGLEWAQAPIARETDGVSAGGGKAGRGKRSGIAAWGGSWPAGGKSGVQRTIEKRAPPPALRVEEFIRPAPAGVGAAKVKGKPKGKGKGKDGAKTRSVVLIPGPGVGPDRSKACEGGRSGILSWASAEMRGWRPAMEDASCALLALGAPLDAHAMFGIFDGHGGATVSRRAAQELPAEVVAAAAEAIASATSWAAKGDEEGGIAGRALKAALPALDTVIREAGAGQPGFLPVSSCGSPIPSDVRNAFALTGSTAVVALLECEGGPQAGRPLRVVVANCGDSRAILCRGGEALALSEDHKPDDPIERARIEKAGGFVAAVGPCQRIDGWGLNLSRALGDFHYKARDDLPPEEQKVSVVPDIHTCEITEEDEFLLLACDGVFELHTSEEAVAHVRQKLQAEATLSEAVESLVDASCSSDLFQTQGRGSDNVSAMVILLR